MENDMLGHFLFRMLFSGSYFRIMSNPSQNTIYSSRNKSQMAPNDKVAFHEKLGLRSNTWGKNPFFYRGNQVSEETMKERGSMYEHFPLCGSAWGAIWSRLLKKMSSFFSHFYKYYILGYFVFRRSFWDPMLILMSTRSKKALKPTFEKWVLDDFTHRKDTHMKNTSNILTPGFAYFCLDTLI